MSPAVRWAFGSWPSPLRPEDLASAAVRLSEPRIDGDDLYWLEGRPSEAGRQVLVHLGPDGVPTDLTAAPFDVRTRVHEYGGGAYAVAAGTIAFSHLGDGRLYRLDRGQAEPHALTPVGPWRYADLRVDLVRQRLIAVREDHGPGGPPVAAIVDVPLEGERPPRVLVQGPDFLAAPRLSPDASRLAWLEWDQPDMPWDATRLRVGTIDDDGAIVRSDLVAGRPDESIAQPEWSAEGTLHFVSDRSGWWNLYRLLEGPRLEALAGMDAEFADPAWILGRSSYGFLADGSILAVGRRDGTDQLFHIDPGRRVVAVETPYTEFDGLVAGQTVIAAVAASPVAGSAVVTFHPTILSRTQVVRRASTKVLDRAYISEPETIAFRSTGGRRAHALYYPPRNPHYRGLASERPPLVVRTHGGPTANASSGLDLGIQLLTTRGIAVVDVDYGGSTGHGRA
ncbi:MAG: hypothetical protein WKF56_02860, partial [Candidatus Limnocylindrales bacterium]